MSAYDALERLAAGIVEKSGGELTADAAMARVLKTAEGRALYELDRREQAQAIADAGLDPTRVMQPPRDAERPRASVRKSERVVLSKAAQTFLDEFRAWLDEAPARHAVTKGDRDVETILVELLPIRRRAD